MIDVVYFLLNLIVCIGFWAAFAFGLWHFVKWFTYFVPTDDIRTPAELRLFVGRALLFALVCAVPLTWIYQQWGYLPAWAQERLQVAMLFHAVQPTNLYIAASLDGIFRVFCGLALMPLALALATAVYDLFYPWERRFYDRNGRTPAQFAAEMNALVRRMNSMSDPPGPG